MRSFLSMAAAALALGACHGSGPPGGGLQDGGDRADAAGSALEQVEGFGDNPGALSMYRYVPRGLSSGAPLVVVLHGCTQNAAALAAAGWNQLADAYHFAVVYPEQRPQNNAARCFDWFEPEDLTRGQGENESIAEMVETMRADYDLDPARVYITGFSAGGAFAAVMLATWPDLFEAGAVMSGLPYRCAASVQGALDCQQLSRHPERKKSPSEWGDLVRQADPGFGGRYPRVSLWHGASDTTVEPDNLTELVEQWTDVHGLSAEPTSTETVAGHEHDLFEDGGATLVESYVIDGMGHAVTFGAGDPDHPCSPASSSSYFEDHGLCSTYRAAAFFGLTE